MDLIFYSHSVAETEQWAAELADSLSAGTVIALLGDLGAGKTVIAKGIGRGLKVKEAIISPTFNYILEYSGRLPLYHADLYRITGEDVFLGMGLDEYFDKGGVLLIEWAERIVPLLPPEAWRISLTSLNETERKITLSRPEL